MKRHFCSKHVFFFYSSHSVNMPFTYTNVIVFWLGSDWCAVSCGGGKPAAWLQASPQLRSPAVPPLQDRVHATGRWQWRGGRRESQEEEGWRGRARPEWGWTWLQQRWEPWKKSYSQNYHSSLFFYQCQLDLWLKTEDKTEKTQDKVAHFTWHIVTFMHVIAVHACYSAIRLLLVFCTRLHIFPKQNFAFRCTRRKHSRSYLRSFFSPHDPFCWVPISVISKRQIIPFAPAATSQYFDLTQH